ncbi:MAG: YciI family protein [Halothiobacillaceae bacterium]|jgi:uncharacterized protein YciI|nr:YciI family protein [Halothiobacillaceae bacterium]
MLYAILATDAPGTLEQRLAARPAHLSRLQALQDEGRLLVAGPFPAEPTLTPGPAGFTGSLILAEFDSPEAARLWAEQDPYRAAGVYADVVVKPWIKVFPQSPSQG